MNKEKCKYCGHEGVMDYYIKFFKLPHKVINISDPKYGFHYGKECPSCDRWLGWVIQTDKITNNKFYEKQEQTQGNLLETSKSE